jgi:hypothetical protein
LGFISGLPDDIATLSGGRMGLFEKTLKVFQGSSGNEAPAEKPGRNEPCWCGSGKKYKKCHLPEDDKKAAAKACALNCGPS